MDKLAEKSGIGKATISGTLNGATTATQKTIYKIAQALDVDVEDLLIEIGEWR